MPSSVVAARWYCVLISGFLLVRATTTLIAGASFDVPGDGWRSLLQLAVVGFLLAGAIRPERAIGAVAVVGLLYALQTVLGLLDGDAILGVIPVDMRDRIVHPTIAALALGVVLMRHHQVRIAS